MQLHPGSLIGRYEVRSFIGAGGMGEVYLAYDSALERDVAIKVLTDEQNDPLRVRRFEQEAKAASALNHPNVAHVYEIGSHDGLHFIAMELVAGCTLRERLARGPIPLDEALSLGTQIAAALAAAHRSGIVHRDVKPENVMIRTDGYAKVLDFGLAKLRESRPADAATLVMTAAGVAMGTLSYMPPEQLSGGEITPAADVFSFGVTLYEMLCGHKPFEGASPTEIATAILTKTPAPLRDVPPELAAVISKALQKNVDQRYPTANEMLEDLRLATPATPHVASGRPTRRWIFAAVAAILVLIAGGFAYRKAKSNKLRNAAVAKATQLIKQRHFAAAVETASSAPADERLRAIIEKATEPATIESEPSGATVYLQRFHGPSSRTRVGVTPLKIVHLAREDYVVTFEKKGYANAQAPLAMFPTYLFNDEAPHPPAALKVRLIESSRVRPEMVFVEGGDYMLSSWSRASDRMVKLDDFLIDRYEVSNRDFEEFVRAGGYRRADYWKTIPFEEVKSKFLDTTGQPGPRSWIGSAPPPGRENYPVADVTWHEAAAFAAWKGKRLPTVYQWEKASRPKRSRAILRTFPWGLATEGSDTTERANFGGRGTMPVDSMPFGISPSGAYHMAGNVSEWCANPSGDGYAVRGGSWNDAVYAFGRNGSFPASYASPQVGFRCVKPLHGDGSNQGEFALSPGGYVPDFKPVDERTFATTIVPRYQYDKNAPLNARVVESVQTADWTRERITYQVAGKTVIAYLYLPKAVRRPLQVVHFSPAGDVVSGWRSLPQSIETSLPPIIRGGRAVFSVVLEGFLERPVSGDLEPDSRNEAFVDYTIARVTELRRGLDYLDTRADIDHTRIGFFGPSAGAAAGVIITAVEPRYRSVVFAGTGLEASEVADAPAANRINFVPRITAPKLMISGQYDESAPLKSEAEPMYRLLREPKRIVVFEGGHVPPVYVSVPTMTAWFDETLGKVQ